MLRCSELDFLFIIFIIFFSLSFCFRKPMTHSGIYRWIFPEFSKENFVLKIKKTGLKQKQIRSSPYYHRIEI